MPTLFSPLKVGPLTAPNRVFMAPMTRCRAAPGGVPTESMARYYAQRASGGLLITEATQVCPEGIGYPGTPGVYTPEQAAAWRRITDAVHARGGRIFCQLWHVGRTSHNAYQPGGAAPVSSSAVAKSGEIMLPDGTKAPYPTPRALDTDEVPRVVEQYRAAARLAKDAGFDGVELHGANGYLPDQFLRDGVNRRTDRYGGPIENRARFHLEITRALADVWGPDRVAVRLSPSGAFNDMRDSTPRETFGYLVRELGRMNLAFLHIMEAMESDLKHGRDSCPGYEPIPVSFFRPMFEGVLVTNSGFTREKAETYLREGWADAIAFGVPYLANPDLPERFARAAPLNTPDVPTFYTGGDKGYIDYPALA